MSHQRETEKKGKCGDLFYFNIKLWLRGKNGSKVFMGQGPHFCKFPKDFSRTVIYL